MVEKNPGKKSTITIVTHNGDFHSDDVFAVAVTCLILEKDHTINIVRSRNLEIIKNADYVIDTGDVYDSEKNRFDHHQRGMAGVRDNGIPYASFGLVWKKYGELLSGSKEIAYAIERLLVLPIDARDNGIDINTSIYPGINAYEIREVLYAFRTTWKEDPIELYDRFIFLVDLAKKILLREIQILTDEFEAKEKVLEIYRTSDDKRLLILDIDYPYEQYTLMMPDLYLAIFPDKSDGNWCIESIRDDEKSYTCRILMPENWAGKRYEELEKVTGVSGSIFCHNNRFFAVAKSKESAIKLAQITLKQAGK